MNSTHAVCLSDLQSRMQDDATERGAIFISEVLVFGFAAGVTLFEWHRSSLSAELQAESRERENAERDAKIMGTVSALEAEVAALRRTCESLQAEHTRAQARAATGRASVAKDPRRGHSPA